MLEDGSSRYKRTFVLYLFSFTLTKCDYILNALEGGGGSFEFSYPCGVQDVTLQYGHRVPFYTSSEPLTLTPDQSGRFKVQTSTSSCLLHLQIEPVKRTDAGTYILLANNNDYMERVGFHVDFLPGKPQCSSRGEPITGDWVKLHCTAPIGSMVGQIQCYQDGTLMPPLIPPYETLRTLEQTIMVQQNHHNVFCCSSSVIQPRERCDCSDFVWDPITENESALPKDPCPASIDIPVSTSSMSPSTNSKSKHTPSVSLATSSLQQISHEKILTEPKQKQVPWYSLLILAMIMLILIISWIILQKQKSRYALAANDKSNRPNPSSSCSVTTSDKETETVEMAQTVDQYFTNQATTKNNARDSGIYLPISEANKEYTTQTKNIKLTKKKKKREREIIMRTPLASDPSCICT